MSSADESGEESGNRVETSPTCPAVATPREPEFPVPTERNVILSFRRAWRAEVDRPPFASPLSSTEMDGKSGEKVEAWLPSYEK